MKKFKYPIFFSMLIAGALFAFGQKPPKQAPRDCGTLTPISTIRPDKDPPCSDSRFFSDVDFNAKQRLPVTVNLDISRYIGDPAALAESGFLDPIAKLRMVMKGECVGQLSEIRFNGVTVNGRTGVCPGKEWKMYEFEVPAAIINFPKEAGGTGKNTVGINPIAGSVTGDWISLEVKVARPALLVHGIFSGPGTWAKWTDQGGFLQKTGLPFNAIDLGTAETIEANAEKIAGYVEKLKLTWNVDKITVIGHSKGAIDSRLFAENSGTVSQLIMIGAPNEGTPIAELLEEVAKNAEIEEYVKSLAPGLNQLSQKNMIEFNRKHSANPSVAYIAIGGDFSPNCKIDKTGDNGTCQMNLAMFSIVGRGDLWVPLRSVYSLSYANNLPAITSKADLGCQFLFRIGTDGEPCEAVHIRLLESERLFLSLKPFIGKPVSE
jgi:pimeloyl-ACP methyl ester carboxylesterase